MTGRCAEAVTVWAAVVVLQGREGFSVPSHPGVPEGWFQRQEPLGEARRELGPDRARAAEERGAAMSLATAAEYALMLTAADPQPPAAAPGPQGLSARERELVTLVAQGHTDAQIASLLYISVRTVGSHLDRIRDKTGCRCCADLPAWPSPPAWSNAARRTGSRATRRYGPSPRPPTITPSCSAGWPGSRRQEHPERGRRTGSVAGPGRGCPPCAGRAFAGQCRIRRDG